MSVFVQNILIFVIFGFAIGFLIKKFFWKSKSKNKTSDSCNDNGCDGCH